METNKPSPLELKQYLKDAGSYDGSLNNNEMYELYEALELSKNTASQDEEQRNIMEETRTNCAMLESLQKSSPLVEDDVGCSSRKTGSALVINRNDFEADFNTAVETVKKNSSRDNNNSSKTPLKEIVNISISFNDVDTYNPLLTTYKPLHNIEIQEIYNFPFYCRPEILALDYSERERAIGEFHCDLLTNFEHSQRQSTFLAPWGKPIPGKNGGNGSVDNKIEKPVNGVMGNQEEDRTEGEFEIFTSRAGRQTKRKLYAENLIVSDSNKKPQHPNPTVAKKRPNLNTIKNEEIMKRSKLFSEPPSRTEKVFDKLFEDESKPKVEKEIDILGKDNCKNKQLDTDIMEITVEEPFVMRRIEAPLPRKKTTKTKPSTRGGRGGTRKYNEKSSSSEGSQTYEPLSSPSTSINNKVKKGICPLCNEQFFQDELENHASTCCETTVVNSNIITRKKAAINQTITCEACDEVFPLNTDYEVHVKECLEQIKRK